MSQDRVPGTHRRPPPRVTVPRTSRLPLCSEPWGGEGEQGSSDENGAGVSAPSLASTTTGPCHRAFRGVGGPSRPTRPTPGPRTARSSRRVPQVVSGRPTAGTTLRDVCVPRSPGPGRRAARRLAGRDPSYGPSQPVYPRVPRGTGEVVFVPGLVYPLRDVGRHKVYSSGTESLPIPNRSSLCLCFTCPSPLNGTRDVNRRVRRDPELLGSPRVPNHTSRGVNHDPRMDWG